MPRLALVVGPLLVGAVVWQLTAPGFLPGMLFGVGVTMVLWVWDDPPDYVGNWLLGDNGEEKTERVLRALATEGWTVVHDVEHERGNHDHIVSGPAGVFLLNSKFLRGEATVNGDGYVQVQRRFDPRPYREPLGRRAKAAAASLSRELRNNGGGAVWVQPVIVFWSEFSQRQVEADGVIYLRGEELVPWLRPLPARHSASRASALATTVARSGATRRAPSVAPT